MRMTMLILFLGPIMFHIQVTKLGGSPICLVKRVSARDVSYDFRFFWLGGSLNINHKV